MVKREDRAVDVQYCDACQTEVEHLKKCAVCKRDLCIQDGAKHSAYGLETYRYMDGQRANLHICKDCCAKKPALNIGELLEAMLGPEPVKC